MTEKHELEFGPFGSRCSCGFTGRFGAGVDHLIDSVEPLLMAAKEAKAIVEVPR